jgi:hypothetical protein
MTTSCLILLLVRGKIAKFLKEITYICLQDSKNRSEIHKCDVCGTLKIRKARSFEELHKQLLNRSNKFAGGCEWAAKKYLKLGRAILDFWEYSDHYNKQVPCEKEFGMRTTMFQKNIHVDSKRFAEVVDLGSKTGLFVLHGAVGKYKVLVEEHADNILARLSSMTFLDVYPLLTPSRIAAVVCGDEYVAGHHLCFGREFQVPTWAKPFSGNYTIGYGQDLAASPHLDKAFFIKKRACNILTISKPEHLQMKSNKNWLFLNL